MTAMKLKVKLNVTKETTKTLNIGLPFQKMERFLTSILKVTHKLN